MATSSEVVIEQVARIVGTAVVVCSYFLVVFPLRVLPLAWALLSCYFVWWSYLSVFVCRFVPVFCEVVFVVHCVATLLFLWIAGVSVASPLCPLSVLRSSGVVFWVAVGVLPFDAVVSAYTP